MGTRTGGFAIGFRRGGGGWQKDLAGLARWAKETGFDAMDIGRANEADLGTLRAAGLRVGTVDLLSFTVPADAGERRDKQRESVAYVREAAGMGAKVFFTCVIPGDGSRKRSENYRDAVEFYGPIAEAAEAGGAKIAIEGWPGGGPNLPNLCCTPESCRAFIRDVGGEAIGLNYDPSHLIRLGVDHIRFLREFVGRVFHVHAKDTEIDTEAVYEYGLYQGSISEKPHGFGEYVWRYTIPGHGIARWPEAFRILGENGFNGVVSIELEDENFNGSDAGEKAALTHGLDFLRSA